MLIMEGIEAVIFDMDGIIIESESLWKQAMIKAFKEIGYESYVYGQKSYNGVAFLSKVKIIRLLVNLKCKYI